MADDFNFDKLNRQGTWKDIFDTIDDNLDNDVVVIEDSS